MFVDVNQKSSEWLQMRCACVTASRMCDVMAKLKRVTAGATKEAAKRQQYRKQKIREQLTGLASENYVSLYMDKGTESEPLARAAYEVSRGVDVMDGGIFVHDTIPRFMASPDGRVGEHGLIEIKCLTGATTDANHLDLIAGADVPEEYVLQVQSQLSCAGPEYLWNDFISYDSEIKTKSLKLFVKRFPRDEKLISAIELETVQFLEEMIAVLKKLGVGDEISPINSLEIIGEMMLDQAAQLSRVP